MNQVKRHWAAGENAHSDPRSAFPARKLTVVAIALLAILGGYVFLRMNPSQSTMRKRPPTEIRQPTISSPKASESPSRKRIFYNQSDRQKNQAHQIALWWGDIPAAIKNSGFQPYPPDQSNIHPSDYAGPESCRECHDQKFEDWSKHPHRWMNAVATADTVKGDFSGATISYLGGTTSFFKSDGRYFMTLKRERVRTYVINQTIGSRFFQYYVGKQTSGPEHSDHHFYEFDHVLPFGFWLGTSEWVPVVHVFDEEPDGKRLDPFDANSYERDFAVYAYGCNTCHTTFPLGDMFGKNPRQMAREVPVNLHWSATNYLQDARPGFLSAPPEKFGEAASERFLKSLSALEAPGYSVTLGVSCEACHLGAKQHVLDPKKLPKFFPQSPHLVVQGSSDINYGRSRDNVNWACGRCHSGGRKQLAAGMSTWNSTEFSDAMRGSCYSQLRCIDCHNPHQAIGEKWARSPAKDDALCIRCHKQFSDARAQAAHAHHPAGSTGSRCMNCHMPRMNEGLQDVVRTHMIFSPTQPDMIHANHPNACNQCHTDKPIDWTVNYLEQWYGAKFQQNLIQAYSRSDQPAALGWLSSSNESVRLIAADSLTRTNATWAADALIDALDDPYLVNRQFARVGLERMLGVRLDEYGYRFYMTPDERKRPITELKKAFTSKSALGEMIRSNRPTDARTSTPQARPQVSQD